MVSFENPKDKEDLNMLNAKIKIIYFGFSKYLNKNGLFNSSVGTLNNADPIIVENFRKIIKNNQKEALKQYNEKCDIWSLGTVCYELARDKEVFIANTMDELWEKIMKGKYKIPKTFSLEIISFLNSTLQYDEKLRSSAQDLLKHDFIVKDIKDFSYINKIFVSKEKRAAQNDILNINN